MKTNLHGIIALLTIAALHSPLLAQAPLPDGGEDNPRVPNVIDQFGKLKHHGEALGFWRRDTPDPSNEKHYQGMVRKNGPGIPYLFLSLNGNHNRQIPGGTDTPGHIIVVIGSVGPD